MSAINIPGYKIIKTLGVGGQATVYLAIQEGFDREIALKVMSPALAADPSFGERFLREAKIVAKLRHPGIVTVFDVGEHDGFYYLAMEYLPETDLRTRITRGIKAKDALWVIQKIAKALHYAHNKGYIHRDVKSENILFRDDGEPVLTDFGIAKASNSSTQMTQTGKLIGTPQYMSPEQCRGRKLDGRSDIYSLGIILYEMLTQKVPFDGEDSVAVCLQHVTKPIPRLSARQKHYQWLLDRMLAKKVEDRFEDAEKLSSEVEEFLAGDISRSQQRSTSELRASREEDIQAIFAEDDMVANERLVLDDTESRRIWPWVVIPILLVGGTVGYLKQELWFPQSKQWFLEVTGNAVKQPEQSIVESSDTAEPVKSNQTVSQNKPVQNNPSANSAELEARQKQIAQLLVEADTLEPLPDLDPAQVRQLLQNYLRVLVLDETNSKAIAGKAATLQRAASYAESALEKDDEDAFMQYYSVIESTAPQHPSLSALDNRYQSFKQRQQQQAEVAEQQQEIDALLEKATTSFAANKLTSPKGESALDFFRQVLVIDPNNSKALEGVESVKSRYVKMAQQSMLNKNIEAAASSIKKLETIDANDSRLAELKQQYASIKAKVDEERRLAALEQEKKKQEEARKKLLADPLTQLKINSKLNAASVAYSENRLVEPEDDSAMSKYRDVLAIDDRNQRALEGIQLIQTKLADLTRKAIQDGNKGKAAQWLVKLQSNFANHPDIPVLKQQISEMDVILTPEPDDKNESVQNSAQQNNPTGGNASNEQPAQSTETRPSQKSTDSSDKDETSDNAEAEDDTDYE